MTFRPHYPGRRDARRHRRAAGAEIDPFASPRLRRAEFSEIGDEIDPAMIAVAPSLQP